MKLADFSIKRPVTISMIMIVLTLLGVISLPLLRVDLYPNLQIPIAVVSTTWSGASPQEVEQQISKPIEKVMSTVPNVTEVDSNSRQNSSSVVVHFSYGTNMDQATLTMRDKLDRIRRSLPTDADASTVTKIDPNSSPIMTIALSGNLDAVELKRLASDLVDPRLQQVDGVASTSITGGKTRQIQIQLDPIKMQMYGLTFTQISQALQGANSSADAGVVNQGNKTINLHVDGYFTNVTDIQNTAIRLTNGNSIYVKDIATVQDTYADVTQLARINGVESVSEDIMKTPDANTVQVSDNIQKTIAQMQSLLPKSAKLTVINDQAKFIKQSINTVVDHTLLGAGFSIIVLWLFLRKIRTTLIIGIVIPISIISTFSMMYFSGQTINTTTLGGLALGMGSLVDFAVVVIESIFRYSSEGLTAKEAASKGTKEVGAAVFASALSQIAVFTPILFTQGLASQLFMPLALTVSFSHIAALFGAITLVPMLASKLMQSTGNQEEHDTSGSRFNPFAVFQRGLKRLTEAYGRLLKWALGHRKTVIITTVLLLVASLATVPMVGFELAPNTDQSQFKVNIQMATGTQLDVTNQLTTKVEKIIQQIPEVTTVFTQIGSVSGNIFSNPTTDRSNMTVNLKPLSERTRSTDQVVEEVRQKVAGIAGARINVSATSTSFGRGGSAVQVQISGDDYTVLQKLSDMVVQSVSTVPGMRNVQSSLDRQIPQYQVHVDRQRAAQYGLTVDQVVQAIRTAYQGSVATQYRLADSTVDVIVQYPEAFTRQFENLASMTINTSSGGQITLGNVATIDTGVGPAQISRQNQTRQITVSADAFNVSQGTAQNEVAAKIAELPVPDGYTVSLGGSRQDLNQSFTALGLAMPFAIVLIYMVMASQFESLFSPFIIMFSLPPTFVGAVLGLVVTHRALSVNALIGVVMLMGIVVNNAIVLVDYTNQLRQRGLSRDEAILMAGPVRLRPILMTTATTVLAMLPLVIGFGEGAEAQAPMATVVAFGLTLSTLVTLVLIPVVYTLFDDFGKWMSARFRRRKKTAPTETSFQS